MKSAVAVASFAFSLLALAFAGEVLVSAPVAAQSVPCGENPRD